MLDIKSLLPELKKLVTYLADDLLARSTAKNDPFSAQVDAGLREAYTQIEKGGRTADAFEVWREDYLDQVAVAWVLGCVFVRFMEDNGLIDECWLAGEGERGTLAKDTHELYFREHPHDSDRAYFEHVFREVGKIPACRDLFADGKTPLWAVGPSGDAAMKLLAYWRDIDSLTGKLKRSFEVENTDTRFLGDLYQDLSERARKKYALLQTPEFVEEFILDKTLEPAIAEFGLDEVRLIDPTCGSGHFLLGAFSRLFERWIKREDNEIVAAQRALDGVYGVDINPFAVAIARFRLMVAALRACGIAKLNRQAVGWKIHVATGDSLLFGRRRDTGGNLKGVQTFFETQDEGSWAPSIYACEEHGALTEILGQQYHAVVGNPPYITPKDRALNDAYRKLYAACHRKYSLSVPFVERFFDLAISVGHAGYIGQITANSFMKREFGKKLIEEFFSRIDLTNVIDTSGAYIPGHGTPTVILFGRNRRPVDSQIQAVLGVKGEPSTPIDPAEGLVWKSIVQNFERCGHADLYTCSSLIERTDLTTHPWSIAGGGISDVMQSIASTSIGTLGDFVDVIGVFGMTNADEVFIAPEHVLRKSGVEDRWMRKLHVGDELRDWKCTTVNFVIFPYCESRQLVSINDMPGVGKWFWPARTVLGNRATFGRGTYFSEGLPWWKWHQVALDRLNGTPTIAYPEVATHNHFVLDREGTLFKHSAPIIKLKTNAQEDDYHGLLAVLNSSISCFWLKQTCHNKGSTVDQHGARQRTDPFEDFFAFNGTRVRSLPLPEKLPIHHGRTLEFIAQKYIRSSAESVCSEVTPNRALVEESKNLSRACRSQMIARQEELDWACYQQYGLIEDNANCITNDLVGLDFGERAFEILMARKMAAGELDTNWFERHDSKPITDVPLHWPEHYRNLVERRIKLIEENEAVRLVERPEYKRRWNTESLDQQWHSALQSWLLHRLESQSYWPISERELHSVAQLADKARADQDFLQVAALYRNRDDFDVGLLVKELVEAESVPFLPVQRYKASGLIKRQVWERTWDLQRQEDAGVDVGEIKVPPKYTSADFLSSDFWRLRGKLDVPKERWISYPHCETESDPSLVVGWAGWNHLQQAIALVAYYDARKREGWDGKRLAPLLAGLDQLIPWLHQWHPEIDPEFGETAGQSFETMLKADAHELGLTLEEIRAWTPPAKGKGGRRKSKG